MVEATKTGVLSESSITLDRELLTNLQTVNLQSITTEINAFPEYVSNLSTTISLKPSVQSKVNEINTIVERLRNVPLPDTNISAPSVELTAGVREDLERVNRLYSEVRDTYKLEGILTPPTITLNPWAQSSVTTIRQVFTPNNTQETQAEIASRVANSEQARNTVNRELSTISTALSTQRARQVLADNLSLYDQLDDIRRMDGSTGTSEEVSSSENRTTDGTESGGLYGPSAPSDPDFVGPIDQRTGTDQEVLREAKEFRVKYSDIDGSTKYFAFSLLPAIESTLRGNNYGQSVPEVKPGLLLNTKVNFKKMNVPGGEAIYQSLGIDQTILQMTGLFVGAEGLDHIVTPDVALNGTNSSTYTVENKNNTLVSTPDKALYGHTGSLGFNSDRFNAVESAKSFLTDVVMSGSPVEIFIRSQDVKNFPILFEYKCLIQGFRTFNTRHDRVYYAIDAVVIKSMTKRLKSSILENNGVRPPTPAAPGTATTPATATPTPATGTPISAAPATTPEEVAAAINSHGGLVQAAIAYGIAESGAETLTQEQMKDLRDAIEEGAP